MKKRMKRETFISRSSNPYIHTSTWRWSPNEPKRQLLLTVSHILYSADNYQFMSQDGSDQCGLWQ